MIHFEKRIVTKSKRFHFSNQNNIFTVINNIGFGCVQELACVYSALILHDDEVEISAENMSKILKAAGADVPAYAPTLFARLLEGKDIEKMLTSAGSPGAGGGGGGAAAPAAGGDAAPAAAAAVEEEEEEEEMDFDLFG